MKNPEFTPQPETRPVAKAETKQEKSARLVSRYIETHVIGKNASLDEAEETILQKKYEKKSTAEKASELYQKMIVYMQEVSERNKTEQKSGSDIPKINPKLISRIKILYNDPAVRELMPAIYGQARVERKTFRASKLANNWKTLEKSKRDKKKQLDSLSRQLFQEKIMGAGNVSEAKTDIIELREDAEENKKAQTSIEALTGYEKTAENTDVASLIEYEKLNEYNRQLTEENFVWLPSREEIDAKAMKVIESGNPKQTRKGVFFISEPGSGKTEQIRAIARRLTGMEHVKISCGPRIGDPQLLGKEKVFPGAAKIEEGTFTDYQDTVSAAWTGYDYSYQKEPARLNSQVVELDEMTKAFDNETFFTRFKGFFALKDGDKMPGTDKPVLPGRVIFGSGNVGAHHGNKPVPPALERELEVIPVDYAEMSAANPELYEFMLACLMKKGAMPPVANKELSPAYKKIDLPENKREILSDRSVAVAIDELIEDPTNKEHGFLYRLAHAVKAVQNSYMARGGENPYIDYTKRELLRSKTDDEGKEYISDTGDPLILGTTITLNDINGWMRGYLEEIQKKNAPTLTEWLQQQLEEKINAKYEDKDKIKAIFDHFHLLDAVIEKGTVKLLTPKEIGYLSPRVPRPVYVERTEKPEDNDKKDEAAGKEQPEVYETRQVLLEDGATILVKVREFGFGGENTASVMPGSQFKIKGENFSYAGIIEDKNSEHDGQPIGQLASGEKLYRVFSAEDLDIGIFSFEAEQLMEDIDGIEKDIDDFCELEGE